MPNHESSILFNLLSNALELATAGDIEVLLRTESDGVELTVRGASSGIRSTLVQELVDRHGGTIRTETTLERGATVTVTLPRRPPEALAPPVDAQSGLSLPRILVADDNAGLRDYLKEILEERWEVETAPDGEAALAALRGGDFDLVLADVMMPRLDGYGLLKAVREDPSTREVPVILLSARADEESRVDGLQSGADDYLIKPFSTRELLARVEIQLQRSTRRHLADHVALRRLHDVSEDLISREDVPTLLESLVDGAISVTDAQMGVVWLHDDDGGNPKIVAARNVAQSLLDFFEAKGIHPAMREVTRTSTRLVIENVREISPFDPSRLEALEAARVRAGQSTPIVTRDGRVLGGLSTMWTRPHRPDPGVLRILDMLAQKAADLLEQRQREEARHRQADKQIHDYQEKLRRMAFDATVADDRERRRLAAVLHDGIGQNLALARIKLAAARNDEAGRSEAIDAAAALVAESIVEARTLTFELSPPILYDLGLDSALSWLIEDCEKRYAMKVAFTYDTPSTDLDDVTAAIVFRAVRELLLNVYKHARAKTATLSLRRGDDRLELSVEDDGVGFDVTQIGLVGDTFGLLSVREQISRLGGTLDVVSAAERGTRATIRVTTIPPSPLPRESLAASRVDS